VTYKPDIADQRESPAVPLAKHLTAKGAVVSFHDPYVESWQVNGSQLLRVDDLDTALSGADLSILLQGHSTYDFEQLATKSRRLLDTRGVVPSAPAVERL
jgi:UDP-N-acetyl-D-mannosaminuronate dehydrogenase